MGIDAPDEWVFGKTQQGRLVALNVWIDVRDRGRFIRRGGFDLAEIDQGSG